MKQEKSHYLEREISWMYFNRRILQEAAKPSVPLLERLTFLGIYSSNLDEFYRVRVATQNRITEFEDKAANKEREEAAAILKRINMLNTKYSVEFEHIFNDLIKALKEEKSLNIVYCTPKAPNILDTFSLVDALTEL